MAGAAAPEASKRKRHTRGKEDTVVTIGGLEPGLIVNADDFGVDPAINAGILSAYKNGIVSSVSLMVTMPLLGDTCRDLRASGMPAGLHLSLTQGSAAAAPGAVHGLVDETGQFCHSALWFMRLNSSNRGDLFRQIQDEFSAQLALARDHDIDLTHVDSHQHIHMNVNIFSIVEQLAPRFGVRRIRWTCEPAWPMFMTAGLGRSLWRRNHIKWLVLRRLARQFSPRLASPDAFFGVLHSGIISKPVLRGLLQRLAPQLANEICIHPGFQPSPALGSEVTIFDEFAASPFRQIEHDALVDPEIADLIRQRQLRLVSFAGAEKDLVR
jgi:chitin disaccharide deacetylase